MEFAYSNLLPEHIHIGKVKITLCCKCLISMLLLLLLLLEFYSVIFLKLYFFLYPHQSEDSTEGIPEGFFDDPKLDAKV